MLPSIAERIVAGGGRLLVVGEAGLLERLDTELWSYARDAFLPHGRSGTARAERQPLLLSPDPEPVNGAGNIVLADGLWREEALGFERAFYFFDARMTEAARAAWRGLKAREGVERHYWKQDERGKWVEGP